MYGNIPPCVFLGFYETLNQRSESGGLPSCKTEVTRSVCTVLDGDGLREVKVEEIQRWLDYWESLGLLEL